MHERPTILVVHPRENPNKCSIEPLRGRAGFVFWRFPERGPEPLAGYLRLGLGARELSIEDRDAGLLLLDGTWMRARRMEPAYADVEARSLPPFATAYPRVSDRGDDPQQGLATIEALHAAHVILGRPAEGLLERYHWREAWLERNRELLARCAARAAAARGGSARG